MNEINKLINIFYCIEEINKEKVIVFDRSRMLYF